MRRVIGPGCTGLFVILWGWLAAGAEAQSWIDGGPDHDQIVIGPNGETYVGVWVEVPNGEPTARRAPMAVSLVIDTSGSMSGEKIDNARMAATSVIETLRDGDIVSVYGFSDGVVEIMEPTILNPAARSQVMVRISGIVASGGTNMFDGLQVGKARLSATPASHAIRRMIVISDGQANIGPSDPYSLGNVAGEATEFGVQVTAIGVGLDYSEQTLAALAVRSSGRLYHLQHPQQMASILRDELLLLANTVALNAYIEIVPAPGVTILEGVSMGTTLEGTHLRVPLGALYGGQRREALMRVRVDAARPGNQPLAEARFVYEDPRGAGRSPQRQQVMLNYVATSDAAAAANSANARVVAMVVNHQAAQAQLQAAEQLNRGDAAAAIALLDRAAGEVRSQASQTPDAQVRARLQARANELETSSQRVQTMPQEPAAVRASSLENTSQAYDSAGY